MKTRNSHIIRLILVLLFCIAPEQGVAKELAMTEGHILASSQDEVDASFTYQGVLKEDGQPVNGERDMDFFIYRSSDCKTGKAWDITIPDVEVDNGLFTVKLDAATYLFDGEAFWLQVVVGSDTLGCQEILPVPYAIGLVPGANVTGAITDNPVLKVVNHADTGSATGVMGQSNSPDGFGVKGFATSTGYGVYGHNPAGVAVGAGGPIMSTSNSVLYLSPHELVVRANPSGGIPDITIEPMEGGGASLINNSGTGVRYFTLPVSTYGLLHGTQMFVKSIKVCYEASSVTIEDTAVLKHNGTSSGYIFYINHTNDHGTSSYACYTADASTPRVPADNSTWVQFNINFGVFPPVYMYIYTIELTLTQLES
jgi:hypothetical protein